MVERNLAKVEVESSRLFSRSRFKREARNGFLFYCTRLPRVPTPKRQHLHQADRVRVQQVVKPTANFTFDRPGEHPLFGRDKCDAPDAGVAQLVERNLAKVEVESSRLFSRSRWTQIQMSPFAISQPSIGERFVVRFAIGVSESNVMYAFVLECTQLQYGPWRGSKVVMQRPAKPCTPVRSRPPPPIFSTSLPRLHVCGRSDFLPQFLHRSLFQHYATTPLSGVGINLEMHRAGCRVG